MIGILRGAALLATGVALGAGAVIYRSPEPNVGRCDSFIPVRGVDLIAHAGGGLPDAVYTNSREAMDLAVAHGFKLIEVDFILRDGQLLLGHHRPSSFAFADFLAWLREHQGVSIVTDMKQGNARSLPLIPTAFRSRFIVQIYDPAEYPAVRRLGFDRVIFTAYRMARDDWQHEVNQLDLVAVTVPIAHRELAAGVAHPVYFHTVNRPTEADGLYTDCLIPG